MNEQSAHTESAHTESAHTASETLAASAKVETLRDVAPTLALHHVGVAVASMTAGWRLYSALGFRAASPVYEDPVQRVRVQFIETGTDVLIELVEPAQDDSPVTNFLKKHGAGLHHLCYYVDDIERACQQTRERGGIVTCEPVPAVAFGGKRVAFVYWHRQLVEFLERGAELA